VNTQPEKYLSAADLTDLLRNASRNLDDAHKQLESAYGQIERLKSDYLNLYKKVVEVWKDSPEIETLVKNTLRSWGDTP